MAVLWRNDNSSLYPGHTKYVEGYIVFVFPSVCPSFRPCVHSVLTFYVRVLREVFLYIKKWRWPGVSVPHWALALVTKCSCWKNWFSWNFHVSCYSTNHCLSWTISILTHKLQKKKGIHLLHILLPNLPSST